MELQNAGASRLALLTTAGLLLVGVPAANAQAPAPEAQGPTADITLPAEAYKANSPVALSVAATDPNGVASVDLYVGTRLISQATQAPYNFSFQPTVQDLNGQTIVAVVRDTLGYQTTVIRRILISPFAARRLTAKTRYFKSKRAPFRVQTTGKITRPSTLPATEGCRTGVIVSYRWRGGSTETRALLDRRTCAFKTSSIFLPRRGKTTVTVAYPGDNALDAIRRTSSIRIR